MKAVVVDYGMGNLRSVAKALEHIAPDADVVVSADAGVIAAADRVIVPGQGAMPDCMHELTVRGLRQAVVDAAASKPFLGICVGLQMLFGAAEEGPSRGLDVIAGSVPRFPDFKTDANGCRLKVPHMGWNRVAQSGEHPLWHGIENDARFYFVHSYYVVPDDDSARAATTEHGLRFTSALARDNIFAVQFHPEKSAAAGLQLLKNFMGWKP